MTTSCKKNTSFTRFVSILEKKKTSLKQAYISIGALNNYILKKNVYLVTI